MSKISFFTLFIFLLTFQPLAYSNSVVEVNTNNLLSMIANSKGKIVIVNFWASWCPYCKKEIKSLIKLRKQYSPEKVKILGISMDTNRDSYNKVFKKYKMNYPCYIASDSSMGMIFGVFGIPVTIVYDRDGRVAKRFSGYVEYSEIKNLIDSLMKR